MNYSEFSIEDDLNIGFKSMFISNEIPCDSTKGYVVDNFHFFFDTDVVNCDEPSAMIYLFSKLLSDEMYSSLIDMQIICENHYLDCDSPDEMIKFREEKYRRDIYNKSNLGDSI
jgi:hypothetical protein